MPPMPNSQANAYPSMPPSQTGGAYPPPQPFYQTSQTGFQSSYPPAQCQCLATLSQSIPHRALQTICTLLLKHNIRHRPIKRLSHRKDTLRYKTVDFNHHQHIFQQPAWLPAFPKCKVTIVKLNRRFVYSDLFGTEDLCVSTTSIENRVICDDKGIKLKNSPFGPTINCG